MVAQQGETVQRIDADVMDINANVSGAQRELLKYYASISSNRWLMLKIFGVLIIFVSSLHPRDTLALSILSQFLAFILVT
jgi:syntaxin 5